MKAKAKHKIMGMIFALICIIVLFSNRPVFAGSATSGTYAIDLDGYFYRTQDAYLPTLTITDLGLQNPEGIAAFDTCLYIADTGNRRVVVYDLLLDQSKELVYDEFVSPADIHVTQDGEIYVADTRAGAVFHFAKDLAFIRKYTRPEDPAYGARLTFYPMRVGVDRRGNLYIVSEGLGDGVIQLDSNGRFLGFFTSNKTSIGIIERLQDRLFSPEVKSKLFPRLPPVFSGLYVDETTGLVYTTAFNSPGSSIKKHNIAGKNMLGQVVDFRDDPVSITVDETGTIYVAYQLGTIGVFSDDGILLFRFGANSGDVDISGLFNHLSDITVDNHGNIWALDRDKSYLQRFTPTDYTLDIQKAMAEYRRGDYDAALESWQAVLVKNEMSVLAHSGLAQIYMLRQEYENAANAYALAGDREGYSQAYWEVRNIYLQNHVGQWLIAFLALYLISHFWMWLRIKKKWPKWTDIIKTKMRRYRLYRDLEWTQMVLKNPSDAFYEMKTHRQGSAVASIIIILVLFLVYLYDLAGKGFIFQNRQIENENLLLISLAFFFLLGLFIIGNTLVASINEGNGKFSDVLTMTGYALVPLVLILPVSTALSNVLTQNESFIYVFLRIIAYGWTFITLSVGIAETHEYLYRNALKNVLLTAFFMIISIVSLVIIFILASQFYDFLYSVIKEVWLRAS